MYKYIKNIIILLIVILALAASAWCFLLKKVTVDERLLTEDSLFNETIIKKRTQEKLTRAEKERESLQGNVDSLLQKAQALEKELVGYKKSVDSFKGQLSSINNDNIIIELEITQSNSNIDNLKNRIDYITRDTLKTSEKLALLTKTRDALKTRLSQYTQEEPIDTIQHETIYDVSESTIQQSSAPIIQESSAYAIQQSTTYLDEEPIASAGEVLTINREFAFIVISLGKRNGITEGMIFNIRRDNRNIGQIRVETVRENISAAALIDKDALSEIRAGDAVFPRYEM